MKIAILTPTFSHYSGIDRVVELQAKEYAKKGYQVTVFALEATIKPKGASKLGIPQLAAGYFMIMKLKIQHILGMI